MIIGEHNLIIGKNYTVISDFSLTVFFAFKNTLNFMVKLFNKIIIKIIPISNSPPF